MIQFWQIFGCKTNKYNWAFEIASSIYVTSANKQTIPHARKSGQVSQFLTNSNNQEADDFKESTAPFVEAISKSRVIKIFGFGTCFVAVSNYIGGWKMSFSNLFLAVLGRIRGFCSFLITILGRNESYIKLIIIFLAKFNPNMVY